MPSKTAFVLGALVLGAAAYAGTSHWLGQQVEQGHQNLLEQTQHQLAPLSAQLDVQWQRGWFSSQASHTLQLPLHPLQPESAPALRISWQDQILHGPWAGGGLASAQIHSRITHIDGLPPAWQAVFDQAGRPEFSGRIGLDGALQGRLSWPAARLDLPLENTPTRLTLQWDELQIDLHTQGQPEQLHSQIALRWPQALAQLTGIDAAQITLRLNDLRANTQMHVPDGLWLFAPGQSELQLALAELDWHSPEKTDLPPSPVQLHTLHINTHTRHQGEPDGADGRIDHDTQLSTRLRWDRLELSALNYENQLQGLDAGVVRQAQALLTQLLQTARAGQPPDIPADTVQALIQRLLATPPQWRERLQARTGDGAEGELAWSVRLAEPDPQLASLPWPFTLPQRLRGDARVQLPKAWLEHTPALPAEAQSEIQSLLQSGLWQDSGTHWQLEATYDADGPKINGQPLAGF